MNSNQKSVSSSPDIRKIIGHYSSLYFIKFNVKPKVNGKICGSMIKKHLKDHSVEGICRIIELYFEDPANQNRVMHLPNILSGWSFNKYLPHIRYNEQIYDGAEDLNKNIW